MMQPEPVLQRELFSWPHNIDAFCHPSILTSLPLLAQAAGPEVKGQDERRPFCHSPRNESSSVCVCECAHWGMKRKM